MKYILGAIGLLFCAAFIGTLLYVGVYLRAVSI